MYETITLNANSLYRWGGDILGLCFYKIRRPELICCPCIICGNATSRTRVVVFSHFIVYGILSCYTLSYHHGEISGEEQSNF